MTPELSDPTDSLRPVRKWVGEWAGKKARRLACVVATVALFGAVAGCDAGSREPASDRVAVSPPQPTTPSSVDSAEGPAGEHRTVTRIVDGDTIVIDGDERVRLIGIDTPETKDPRRPVECFGQEASDHLAELLPVGTPVRVVYDVERLDRYDRTLAYLYRASDGLFVNAAMVRDGYASAYTVPPNVAHADEFVAFDREAREAGRGLWSACDDA